MSNIPTAETLRKAFDGDSDAIVAAGVLDSSGTNDQLIAVAKRAIEENFEAMQDIVRKAESESRDLLASEKRKWDAGEREMSQLRHLVEMNTLETPVIAFGASVQRNTDTNTDILTRGQSLSDWTSQRGVHGADQEGVRLGSLLRSWVTGRRDGMNDAERRTMAEGTASAGGVIVPTPTASQLIDAARNKARVFQAGAVTVPMTSETLSMPRLTGVSAPAWRNENAQIASGDLTLDAVKFTARSLAFEVKCSRELLEDSDPNAGDMIMADLAAQVALELDRVALRGSGTAPEPSGILNQDGVTITTHGTNGAAASYDFLIDAEGAVRAANHEPTATILAPAVETGLRKSKTTEGLYITPPAGLVPRYTTNQVPTNLTVGTSTKTSEIYTGDFSQLMVGMRTGPLTIQLVERYADMGQVAFIVWVRADVQLQHGSAFVVDTGIKTASAA